MGHLDQRQLKVRVSIENLHLQCRSTGPNDLSKRHNTAVVLNYVGLRILRITGWAMHTEFCFWLGSFYDGFSNFFTPLITNTKLLLIDNSIKELLWVRKEIMILDKLFLYLENNIINV